jgi:hypothetical protein
MNVPDFIPTLSHGKHRDPAQGACIMEMVAFLAGEEHTDHPQCVHEELISLGISTNDFVSNDNRNRLALLIPIFMNTRDLKMVYLRRRVQAEVLPEFSEWVGPERMRRWVTGNQFDIKDVLSRIHYYYYNVESPRYENKVYDDAAIEYLEAVMAIVKDMKGEEPIDLSVGINHPSQVKANA